MVILICISLVISEHFSMYLLAIYISSLEKCLFRSSEHFKNQIVLLLFWVFFCY